MGAAAGRHARARWFAAIQRRTRTSERAFGDRAAPEAQVLAWEKQPVTIEDSTHMKLTVRFLANGFPREAEFNVLIEDLLVRNFAPGETIHVLYDPADPTRVAVDRARSPIEVPSR